MPNYGDKVSCRPAPGHSRVLADPVAPRFFTAEGGEEVWTPHLAARLGSGEILLVPIIAPRELADGELLEEATLPPGATAVVLPPGSSAEKEAGALPPELSPLVQAGEMAVGGAPVSLDTTQPVKE